MPPEAGRSSPGLRHGAQEAQQRKPPLRPYPAHQWHGGYGLRPRRANEPRRARKCPHPRRARQGSPRCEVSHCARGAGFGFRVRTLGYEQEGTNAEPIQVRRQKEDGIVVTRYVSKARAESGIRLPASDLGSKRWNYPLDGNVSSTRAFETYQKKYRESWV